jgi:hypothetical protein
LGVLGVSGVLCLVLGVLRCWKAVRLGLLPGQVERALATGDGQVRVFGVHTRRGSKLGAGPTVAMTFQAAPSQNNPHAQSSHGQSHNCHCCYKCSHAFYSLPGFVKRAEKGAVICLSKRPSAVRTMNCAASFSAVARASPASGPMTVKAVAMASA